MKRLIISIAIMMVLFGCSKSKTPIYFMRESDNYNIVSFEDISMDEEVKINYCFLKVMEALGQKELREKFRVKIFYNPIAFKTYVFGKDSTLSYVESSYNKARKEICIPKMNFNFETLSHEIVHAIIDVNNLEPSDEESLAYKISEKILSEEFWRMR